MSRQRPATRPLWTTGWKFANASPRLPRGGGRAADEITLVAVSKQKPMRLIEAAYVAGQRDFGENRFDEVDSKIEAALSSGLDEIRWHFIGTIQSRQTSSAVGPFALLHSVDRLKIARRLSRDVAQLAEERASDAADGNFLPDGTVLSTLLQVNVSGEASKHGFAPGALADAASVVDALPGISARGLMTMAPYALEAEAARPVFRELRALRDQLAAQGAAARQRRAFDGHDQRL